MWWKSSCVIILCIVFITSCSKIVPKEEVHPFSVADKIEIISYPDRMDWDTNSEDEIVESGKLAFDTNHIRERKEVNEGITDKLYSFLFIEGCPLLSDESRCYMPRHAILFYDANDSIYDYVEVCLECGKSEGSFQFNDLCPERAEKLGNIFKEAGIQYFGGEEYGDHKN